MLRAQRRRRIVACWGKQSGGSCRARYEVCGARAWLAAVAAGVTVGVRKAEEAHAPGARRQPMARGAVSEAVRGTGARTRVVARPCRLPAGRAGCLVHAVGGACARVPPQPDPAAPECGIRRRPRRPRRGVPRGRVPGGGAAVGGMRARRAVCWRAGRRRGRGAVRGAGAGGGRGSGCRGGVRGGVQPRRRPQPQLAAVRGRPAEVGIQDGRDLRRRARLRSALQQPHCVKACMAVDNKRCGRFHSSPGSSLSWACPELEGDTPAGTQGLVPPCVTGWSQQGACFHSLQAGRL